MRSISSARVVVASLGVSVVLTLGCGEPPAGPSPSPSPSPSPTVTVEFGGRVVNAETGGPVESVRVSAHDRENIAAVLPKGSATSGGDGTFTLPLNLTVGWRFLSLKLTGPPGYDDRYHTFEPTNAADRPAIRMYPTLVIRPGESIDVRVDGSIVWCGWDGYSCRRVLVAASPGDSVELEVVSHDSTKPMALGLANPANPYNLEPDMSVRRLVVPPGGVPYVIGEYPTGTATLTARR
jgi:hypothetical protein